MTKGPRHFKSVAAIARHFRVSESTVHTAKRRHGEFPARVEGKGFPRVALESFAREHGIWHRGTGTQAAADSKAPGSLADSRRRLNLARLRREKIEGTKSQIELDLQLGGILLAEDVTGLFQRTVATAVMLHQAIVDRIDRAAPATVTGETWATIRSHILSEASRGIQDAQTALEMLVAGATEEV